MLRLPGSTTEAFSVLGLSLLCHRVSGPEQSPLAGNMLLPEPEGLAGVFISLS